MKKVWLTILASLIFGAAAQAGAAVISYAPGDLTITVSPGENLNSAVDVSADTLSGLLIMQLNSTLPPGWIAAGKVNLSPARVTQSVPLEINIPPTAAAGVYGGRLVPQIVMAPRTERVNSGSGIAVQLIVSGCTEPPMLTDIVVGPQTTLVPNGKEITVKISGVVKVAEGCTLQELAYKLEDEYGEHSSSGLATVDANGGFNLEVLIEASRRGQDKDGRLYSGTLTATGKEAGSTEASFSITVAHDQGKGNDK